MRGRRTRKAWTIGLAVIVTTLGTDLRAQKPSSGPPASLEGTSWQLVRFQAGDDKTLDPGERVKYTIAFATAGRLTMRFDCNRGNGTWKSSEPGQLEFGRLTMTRVLCAPGSLYDRLVQDMEHVRSYFFKGRRLFLALMGDGGIYEFEPVPTTAP